MWMPPRRAPEWYTTRWFNTPTPLSLQSFRGQVVILHAFQMLCPGCVGHALPQMKRAKQLFADSPIAVVGLHTVFEHHEAMNANALAAFLKEYRVDYPVGIDAPDEYGSGIPQTMQRYGMRGTPTTILIDPRGRIRREVFGADDDLLLGAAIGTLLGEQASEHDVLDDAMAPRAAMDMDCSLDACLVPATLPDTFARAFSAS